MNSPAKNLSDSSTQNRREFLRATGAATAGVMLASQYAYAAEPTRRKIRMGVVGGNFGNAFFWHEHPDCVVEAVSDLIPARRERLMKTYKCSKSYESLEKLILDKNIDAVAIFTPAPDHVRHVVAALKAGKHAICAVPAAQTLEDCHVLIE